MAAARRHGYRLPAGVFDGAAQLDLRPRVCIVQFQLTGFQSAGDAAGRLSGGGAWIGEFGFQRRRAGPHPNRQLAERPGRILLDDPAQRCGCRDPDLCGRARPDLRSLAAAAGRSGAGATRGGAVLPGRRRPLSFSHLVSHHGRGHGFHARDRHRLAAAALPGAVGTPGGASALAMACIRPRPAAKECRMSKEPTGIANGLTNYGDRDFSLYLRRSFAKSMGYSSAMLEKPVVGIAYTASGFNNCHRHFPELLEAVKRGVLAAGALPIEFPTISLGEVFLNPTSLKFRNLMSMDTEEMVRAQPMDAVVLMGGCDKTVPAQLMGAVSAGRPATS